MTQSRLPSALLKSARSYAGQLTSLAKSKAPKHLQEYIHSKAEEVQEGVVRIRVGINRKDSPQPNYGTLDAAAQEYGAKLHPIVPKNKEWLEFDGTNAYDGWLIRTKKVNHPGMTKYKGTGYLRPAINEFRAKLRGNSSLNQEIKRAILGDIKVAFTGAKK